MSKAISECCDRKKMSKQMLKKTTHRQLDRTSAPLKLNNVAKLKVNNKDKNMCQPIAKSLRKICHHR